MNKKYNQEEDLCCQDQACTGDESCDCQGICTCQEFDFQDDNDCSDCCCDEDDAE